jgi:hypothetical protein
LSSRPALIAPLPPPAAIKVLPFFVVDIPRSGTPIRTGVLSATSRPIPRLSARERNEGVVGRRSAYLVTGGHDEAARQCQS